MAIHGLHEDKLYVQPARVHGRSVPAGEPECSGGQDVRLWLPCITTEWDISGLAADQGSPGAKW